MSERYPMLTEHGQAMLQRLREHPAAPRYHNESGNKLSAADLAQVLEHERMVERAIIDHGQPAWLSDFVSRCFEQVPYFRRQGSRPASFFDVPTIDRGELARDVAQFVPDDVAIDRLINFTTSGTTGHPLWIASHPIVAASYLAYHKRALRRFGVELRYGRGQVGVVLLGFQRKCFTYVSVTPSMGESGLAKINLHPDDWRAPSDREAYLDALDPEVIAGDPLSFYELLELPLRCRPRALLSTSMALRDGLAERLRARFECPVLDIYSLNEAGPIAVYDAAVGGHVLLQERMYVEIVDAAGQAVPTGTRGEVTLSGGFNFCLPLLRYRTGDYATLSFEHGEPVLLGLEGRRPVRFRTAGGEWLNNLEVSHALARFAIPQYTLHQARDGGLLLHYRGLEGDLESIRAALVALFGADAAISVQAGARFDGKVRQYTSLLDHEAL